MNIHVCRTPFNISCFFRLLLLTSIPFLFISSLELLIWSSSDFPLAFFFTFSVQNPPFKLKRIFSNQTQPNAKKENFLKRSLGYFLFFILVVVLNKTQMEHVDWWVPFHRSAGLGITFNTFLHHL